MPPSKTDQAIQKVADSAHAATDKLADKAEQAVDATRTALDKAERQVRTLREDLKPAIDAAACRAQDTAHRCCDTARLYADKTSAYVAAQPLKSMLIAASAGALITLLLGRRR